MIVQTNNYGRQSRRILLVFLIFLIGIGLLSACAAKTAVIELDISVPDAYELYQDDIFVLDVRTPEEYQVAHIPGAVLIPLDQLNARYGELPQDEPILVYCRSGNRSKQAQSFLLGAGFSEIINMVGGINTWISAGYEIETGK